MAAIVAVAVIVPIVAIGIIVLIVWWLCRLNRKGSIFSRQLDKMDGDRKQRITAHAAKKRITPASAIGPPVTASSHRIRNNKSFSRPQPSFEGSVPHDNVQKIEA